MINVFFFSSRRRHTRLQGDWSSDVCSSDLERADTTGVAREFKRRLPVPPFSSRTRSLARAAACVRGRSEERRVGKEGRSQSGAQPEQEQDGIRQGRSLDEKHQDSENEGRRT